MIRSYAILSANKEVENLVVCDDLDNESIAALQLIEAPQEVDIGWVWDGTTFLPPASAQQSASAIRKAEIISHLEALDLKSIRALRSGDTKKLAEIEDKCAQLRAELAGLPAA